MGIDHSSPYHSLAGKRTYTVEEIAKILGIGRTAAYSFAHSGVFKAVRIGFSIDELVAGTVCAGVLYKVLLLSIVLPFCQQQ